MDDDEDFDLMDGSDDIQDDDDDDEEEQADQHVSSPRRHPPTHPHTPLSL